MATRIAVCRGTLKLIGQGTVRNGVTSTSVIEIGDNVIKNVVYPDLLATYLKVALDSGEQAAIALEGKDQHWLFAIKIGGKLYRDDSVIERGKFRAALFLWLFVWTPLGIFTVPYYLYRLITRAKKREIAARDDAANSL